MAMSNRGFIVNRPTTPDVLYTRYCHALSRWQSSRSERDLAAVRESYREFAVAFLGEPGARPLIATAERRWGGAA
jgi:hypothetical protein